MIEKFYTKLFIGGKHEFEHDLIFNDGRAKDFTKISSDTDKILRISFKYRKNPEKDEW